MLRELIAIALSIVCYLLVYIRCLAAAVSARTRHYPLEATCATSACA